MDEIDQIIEFLKVKIKEAGRILIDNYKSPEGIKRKKDGTLVSDADKKSSLYLERALKERYPEFGIIDEENEDGAIYGKKYCFVIDPLDGTRAYLEKENSFSILIGLLRNNIPVLGVAYRPMTQELFFAIKDKGAFLEIDGKVEKINVRKNKNLNVLVTNSRYGEGLDSILKKIKPHEIVKMGGSIKIAEVAKGNADAFICSMDNIMHVWDLCALEVILEESGGIITDLEGNKFDYSKDNKNDRGVIAASKQAYEIIIKDLRKGFNMS
jgi:3'(2'),5'-bisphosphate nucleotidase